MGKRSTRLSCLNGKACFSNPKRRKDFEISRMIRDIERTGDGTIGRVYGEIVRLWRFGNYCLGTRKSGGTENSGEGDGGCGEIGVCKYS